MRAMTDSQPRSSLRLTCRRVHLVGLTVSLGLAWGGLAPDLSPARSMQDDPKGFQGIPWGASLQDIVGLKLVDTWRTVQEFEYKDGPPPFADASLQSVTLSTVSGKFARVTIKYHGEETHNQIMAHLESRFGKIDLMPGSMMRGLNQQYNWRGTDTEINLTYEGFRERGVLFIESRAHVGGFTALLPEGY